MRSRQGEKSAIGNSSEWREEDLEAQARASECGEVYHELTRGEDYRVGVVATAYPSSCVVLSLEVSLRLCRPDGEVHPAFLERAAKLSRVLQRRGYSVNHLDDGWIVCEKPLFKEEIAAEREYVLASVLPIRGHVGEGIRAGALRT